MIQFKIYNDDRIRRFNGFPTLKDPNILENSLLRILNEYYSNIRSPVINEFNINNPYIANTRFLYCTSSNLQSWGELPLGYIYNDMVRHIQNQNTSSNFIMTLESIFIEGTSVFSNNNYIPYEIVTAYVKENYLGSYNYITSQSNGVLVVFIPVHNEISPDYPSLMSYIISVGFDPVEMSKWFCTSLFLTDPNALPYSRACLLKGIVNVKTGNNSPFYDLDPVYSEYAEGRIREKASNCVDYVNKYRISELKKKSIYDTEVKYGNYPIDYNWLNTYDIAVPASYFCYVDRNNDKFLINKFNQVDYRIDYRLLKQQNNMIDIHKKRSGL